MEKTVNCVNRFLVFFLAVAKKRGAALQQMAHEYQHWNVTSNGDLRGHRIVAAQSKRDLDLHW